MSYDVASRFEAACPGVVMIREMFDALNAAYPATSSAPTLAQVQAVILPLIPDGNPPQYFNAAPIDPPAIMPGASPVYTAALPPQPTVAVTVDGAAARPPTFQFAKGLPLFQDSNPDPIDGWSVEFAEAGWPGAPR